MVTVDQEYLNSVVSEFLQSLPEPELPLKRCIRDIVDIAANDHEIYLLQGGYANKPPEGGEGGLPEIGADIRREMRQTGEPAVQMQIRSMQETKRNHSLTPSFPAGTADRFSSVHWLHGSGNRGSLLYPKPSATAHSGNRGP